MGDRLEPYRVLLASRMRAQMQYRASFVTDILGTVGVGLAEFAEVWVIFHNVNVLGGLDFTAALLVFALSNIAFSPLLAQLITSDLSLRRIGRLSVALVALTVALTTADIAWSPAVVALLVLTIVSGTAIFSALFTAAGGLQFFLVDGAEFTNSFTYGGAYSAQQSQQVFPGPLRIFWTFVIPTAFVAYLPAITILDLPGDRLAPSWLAWCTPLAAGLAWTVAGLCWRAGTRHYQGAGG